MSSLSKQANVVYNPELYLVGRMADHNILVIDEDNREEMQTCGGNVQRARKLRDAIDNNFEEFCEVNIKPTQSLDLFLTN